jgi:hypothetical protein
VGECEHFIGVHGMLGPFRASAVIWVASVWDFLSVALSVTTRGKRRRVQLVSIPLEWPSNFLLILK